MLCSTGAERGRATGCWRSAAAGGAFAEAALARGIRVHGITLSEEQKSAVEQRLGSDVEVTLTDYRDVDGTYDAVASCEMVEAVGEEYWPAYLGAIARALKPGGRAAIQYIAIDDAVFPAYRASARFHPALCVSGRHAAEREPVSRDRGGAGAGVARPDRVRAGLCADAAASGAMRFDAAAREGRLPARFDSRFQDLWRYYLMYCEGGFLGGGIDVAQVTLIKGDG